MTTVLREALIALVVESSTIRQEEKQAIGRMMLSRKVTGTCAHLHNANIHARASLTGDRLRRGYRPISSPLDHFQQECLHRAEGYGCSRYVFLFGCFIGKASARVSHQKLGNNGPLIQVLPPHQGNDIAGPDFHICSPGDKLELTSNSPLECSLRSMPAAVIQQFSASTHFAPLSRNTHQLAAKRTKFAG